MKWIKWAVLYVLLLIIFWGSGIWMIAEGESFGYFELLMGVVFVVVPIWVYIKGKEQAEIQKKQEEAKKIEEARKQERIDKLNQQVKDGKWTFPAGKFYQLCRDSHVTVLDNEFSMRKAIQIAEQVIKETAPDIDLANCGEYLKTKSLEGFLQKGEVEFKEAEERKLLAQKQPRNANPNDPEKTFIERVSKLAYLSGTSKREKMLENLSADYIFAIARIVEGRQALAQLGMIYASQQQKESSWAVMGGIAEGIAGPSAGIIAASQTIANNRKIQEHNAAMRKASMDIMSGIPNLVGDTIKLHEERDKIKKAWDEAKTKVVLSKPIAEEIWQNINVGKATVKKNPSGVLTVSIPVSLKAPFVLDVPDNVRMVVDGVLRGEVWFEDKRVDTVYFPLPIYGIPHNMTAEIILDGMCGRSVEFDGEYTVKIGDYHNLWIMEA